ncbi:MULTISPECIES: rhodanese-like domain-containing protein [Mycobacteriaceae]|uniref:Rhodanese-like domain-containing protein n=1 Tax=Mycolicibacterium parafortuitum TaxID=39692 RepID=A0ACC6MNF2_MYCPF|nr:MULTISPECIES: rhodanese-like domain-containing protein [Mycobacteriaceae]MDZ5088430.1 rhodanese-like domain-containing protein [Mycolicibacterium parafortuitum]
MAFAVVLTLSGCSANDSRTIPAATSSPSATDLGAPAGMRSVGPPEFERAIAGGERVMINVHVPYEGEIAGTDLSIPFDRIEAESGRLPSDRSVPLAIYCRSDRMSAVAAQSLSRLGYDDIVELDGGMQAWEQSGRALIWR